MHAEIVSTMDTTMKLPSQHPEGKMIFSSFSAPERQIFTNKTNQVEKRIWELVPTFGVEKTYQILLDERKKVSLNEVLNIAIKKFGENIKTKDLSIHTSEDF
jgi:hypothetical protein